MNYLIWKSWGCIYVECRLYSNEYIQIHYCSSILHAHPSYRLLAESLLITLLILTSSTSYLYLFSCPPPADGRSAARRASCVGTPWCTSPGTPSVWCRPTLADDLNPLKLCKSSDLGKMLLIIVKCPLPAINNHSPTNAKCQVDNNWIHGVPTRVPNFLHTWTLVVSPPTPCIAK